MICGRPGHGPEREVVQRALARSNSTLATAARLLGISRPTLYTLLDAHGLSADAGLADGAGDDAPHPAHSENIGRNR